MSIFEAYKQEFSSLQNEISKNLDDFRNSDAESGFAAKDRQVEALLAQANDLLKQMEVEVRSQDASKRKELSEKGTNLHKLTHSTSPHQLPPLCECANSDRIQKECSGNEE